MGKNGQTCSLWRAGYWGGGGYIILELSHPERLVRRDHVAEHPAVETLPTNITRQLIKIGETLLKTNVLPHCSCNVYQIFCSRSLVAFTQAALGGMPE